MIITCPGCRAKLELLAEPGMRFHCPSCQTQLMIGTEPKAPSPAIPVVTTQPVRPARPAQARSLSAKPARAQEAPSSRSRDFDDEYVAPRRRRRGRGVGNGWVRPVAIAGIATAAVAIVVAVTMSLRPREAERENTAPPSGAAKVDPAPSPAVSPPAPAPASASVASAPPASTVAASKPAPEVKRAARVPGLDLDESELKSLVAATVRVRRKSESGKMLAASGFVAATDGKRCFIVTCRRIVEEFDFARDGFGGDMRMVTLGGIAGIPRKTVPERWWAFGIDALGKGLPPSESLPSPALGVAAEVEVTFPDAVSKPRTGKVLLVDEDFGLALIDADAPGPEIKPIRVGSEAPAKPDATMFALGFPEEGADGEGEVPARATGRFLEAEKASAPKSEEIRFQAEVRNRFEGGPAFDAKGRFAGAVGLATKDGGTAIPAARVAELLKPRIGALRVMTPLASMAPQGKSIPARARLVGGPWKEVKLVCSGVRTGNPGDPLEKEKGAKTTPLAISGERAAGEIPPEAIDLDGQLYCQAVGTRADGTTTRSPSRLVSVRPGGPRVKSEFEKRGLEPFPQDGAFAGSYQYREDFGAHYLRARDDKAPVYAQEKDGACVVETGLGARFLTPRQSGATSACALSHTEISRGTVRLTAVSTRTKSGTVYFGGTVQGGGWLTEGMERSEVQRIARDVFVEALGGSTPPTEFEVGAVKGMEFTIERVRLAGAREAEDHASLRVVVVANRGAVHFFGRLGGSTEDAFAERFFSSFELPAKTRIRPPQGSQVVSIKTGS
jgi:hypothetical protein